jgi:phosphinothricin acetyltransferase
LAEFADAAGIAAVYNHYVLNTVVTFEEQPVAAAEMAGRMEDVRAMSLPWLVAEEAGRVVGYAYATRWRARAAYRYSSEITVYLAHDVGGRGIGTLLYGRLFPLLEARGLHAIMGGIALPNEASVRLHEKFGMRKAAHFHEVGFKFGRWIDVGFWQRVLAVIP